MSLFYHLFMFQVLHDRIICYLSLLVVVVTRFILAYGAMVAYLIIIKDTVPVALGFSDEPGEGDFWETELVMVVTSIMIILPLSIQRDMANLSFTSFSSVLADVILVLLVALFAPYPGNVGDILKAIFENAVNSRLFIGLGVLSTAMACQHSAFIVSGSLEDRTPERWSRVTFRSIGIAWLLCTIMGTTGYLGFEEETKVCLNQLNNALCFVAMLDLGIETD